MKIKSISDRNKIFSFLKLNKCLYSYHIGDLDDFFFQSCEWIGLFDNNNRLIEIILVFKGLSNTTVLAFGNSNLFSILLKDQISKLPTTFFCHFQPENEKLFVKSYEIENLGLHYKMRLKNLPSFDYKKDKNIINLSLADETEILDFYALSYPGTYFESKMLESKQYYGYLNDKNQIIHISGVHVYSEEWNIAVLGNITTHPDYRGRGIAKRTLSFLLSQLTNKVDYIGLNVKQDNHSAIKLYEMLGFEVCAEYKEGLFTKI